MTRNFATIAAALLLLLLAACTTSQPGMPALSIDSITPDQVSIAGGTTVTLEGDGFFQALSGSYPHELQVSICGAPLTDLRLTNPQERATVLPGGAVNRVQVSSTLTGTTSTMTDTSGDIIVTRPDGRSVTIEGAATCYDPEGDLALPDSFDVLGNVSIAPPSEGGLLANDVLTDFQVLSFGASAADTPAGEPGTSSKGGNLAVNADGSFSYDPPAGFTGSDTFEYRASNGTDTADATVTLTVAGMIWFIDAEATGGGDGRLSAPFDSPASYRAGASHQPGDSIFLFENAAAYPGPLLLDTEQRLIGQDARSPLATLAGLDLPAHAQLPEMNPGGESVRLGAGSPGVQLSSDNRLYGLTIESAGPGVMGSSFGTLIARDLSIYAQDVALQLADGDTDIVLDSTSSSGGNRNVQLVQVSGSVDLGAGLLRGSIHEAVVIVDSPATITYAGDIHNESTTSVVLVGSGDVTLSGDIDDTGAGMHFVESSVTLDGRRKRLHTGNDTPLFVVDSQVSLPNGGLDILTNGASGTLVAVADFAPGSLTISGPNNRIEAIGDSALAFVGPFLHIEITLEEFTALDVTLLFKEVSGSFTVTGTSTFRDRTQVSLDADVDVDFGTVVWE